MTVEEERDFYKLLAIELHDMDLIHGNMIKSIISDPVLTKLVPGTKGFKRLGKLHMAQAELLKKAADKSKELRAVVFDQDRANWKMNGDMLVPLDDNSNSKDKASSSS